MDVLAERNSGGSVTASAQAVNKRFPWVVRPAPIEYVLLVVGLGSVLRYLWILDDSFIYFRYVDNVLFLHRGLVFNQGEFVEGYSSPLWLLVLIILRATHLDYWTIVAAIATVSFLAFGYGCIVINRALQADDRTASVNLPLAFLTSTYGVASYFSSGSESPLMQLAACVIAAHALFPRSKSIQLLVGLLPLVRNEFVIPCLVTIVGARLITRRTPWISITSAVVAGGAWIIFRVWYYSELFPTPFYLKDKVAVAQGLYYVRNCVEPYGLHMLLAAAVVALTWLWYSRDRSLNLQPRALMWAAAMSSVPYVVKVGGDMMHYRLLAFPFCLMTLSIGGIAERLLSSAKMLPRATSSALSVCVAALCLGNYPAFLSSHPVWGHEERTLDHGISDAAWHRHHSALSFNQMRRREDQLRIRNYPSVPVRPSIYATEVFCATMFAQMEKQFVHGYGLTEPILARLTVPEERPGHKAGLFRPASQLAKIRSRFPDIRRGLAMRAVQASIAPAWLKRNIGKVSLVESRMYNSHDFLRNLSTATQRVGPIIFMQINEDRSRTDHR